MLNSSVSYDIIGDIHGELPALVALLDGLDYRKEQGVWQHRKRKAIFLGDFIDRGRYQLQVLELVRPMVENGHALAVMGNHEYNAIAFATQGESGEYLRLHTENNRKQHQAFLDDYEMDSTSWQSAISWFKTLPLWLDLGELRVIHACWDQTLIKKLETSYKGSQLTDELLQASSQKGEWEFDAIETLLKGKEIPLPDGHAGFHDKDGILRHHIRIRWWDAEASKYREVFMGPEDMATDIPDDPIPGDHLVSYGHKEKPVFLGHYWLSGEPRPLAPNIASLDYSVAKQGGKLVAYRWDGEQTLNMDKFFWCD